MSAPETNETSIPEFDDNGLPAYSEDGVDLTMIRQMLRRTPAERLDYLMAHLEFVLAVRKLNAKT